MSKNLTVNLLTAVVFTLALALAGSAQAGVVYESGDGPSIATVSAHSGVLGTTFGWISEVWKNLTGILSASTTTGSGATTNSGTTNCGEAGWEIDPNGCPNG